MSIDDRPTIAAPDDDPYLWLEEIEGEPALAFVTQQNARTLQSFGDAGFAGDRDTLADIYMRQSQPALAEPLWRELITRDPQPAYRYRLARALRALGRGDEARAELERALAGKAPFAERADAEKALAELPRPAGS